MSPRPNRLRGLVGRASRANPNQAQGPVWRGVTLVVFAVAGGLCATSALNAGGLPLRASSITDLATLVQQQKQQTDALQQQAGTLTRRVEALTRQVRTTQVARLQAEVDALKGPAGLDPVSGPGVSVTLDDAPASEIDNLPAGGQVTVEDLLVHQQDIQAMVNALWSGGAVAISLQGQRVVATTSIKCVGNTVIVRGVPYSPPYVVRAVGSPARLEAALRSSAYVAAYRLFVTRFHLGYAVHHYAELRLPAYTGPVSLAYSRPITVPSSGTGGATQ